MKTDTTAAVAAISDAAFVARLMMEWADEDRRATSESADDCPACRGSGEGATGALCVPCGGRGTRRNRRGF